MVEDVEEEEVNDDDSTNKKKDEDFKAVRLDDRLRKMRDGRIKLLEAI